MSRRGWSALLLAAGAGGLVAVAAAPARAAATAAQIWAPFVLVTGLLLIGATADADGLFAAGGDRLARLPGRPVTLFVAALGLVAAVTAVLNLDTAVVFVTPVLLVAAASRGIESAPFLYGSVAMCNAASLLLPGANLTNLLVLGSRRVSGATFAVRMAPASVAAVVVTGVVLAVFFRRALRGGARSPGAGAAPSAGAGVERGAGGVGPGAGADGGPPGSGAAPLVVGPGLVATVAAAAIVLLTRDSALFVLPLGIAAVVVSRRLGRLQTGRLWAAVDLRPLLLLFLVALALGTLARSWSGPARLLAGTTSGAAAALAAAASVLVNNLPAAALFSAHGSIDGRALARGARRGPQSGGQRRPVGVAVAAHRAQRRRAPVGEDLLHGRARRGAPGHGRRHRLVTALRPGTPVEACRRCPIWRARPRRGRLAFNGAGFEERAARDRLRERPRQQVDPWGVAVGPPTSGGEVWTTPWSSARS